MNCIDFLYKTSPLNECLNRMQDFSVTDFLKHLQDISVTNFINNGQDFSLSDFNRYLKKSLKKAI